MQLTVRTRADAKPQGKPRVALLCHPDDYGRWAGELASAMGSPVKRPSGVAQVV